MKATSWTGRAYPARRRRLSHGSARQPWKRLYPLLALPLVLTTTFTIYLFFSEPDEKQEHLQEAWDQAVLQGQPSFAFCLRDQPPLICAHGGNASTLAPPNTMAAFKAAADGGFACMELDVALTLDGYLVVLHKRELDLLQGGSTGLQVADLTLRQVLRLKWPNGQGVPLAADVIRLLHASVQRLILDVKVQERGGELVGEDSMAQAVVDLVADTACSRCLVWSKADGLVRLVRELTPKQSIGYIIMPAGNASAQGMRSVRDLLRMPEAEVAGVHHAMATLEQVDAAHAQGQLVYAWTANTDAMMAAVLDAGADAIVTNFPEVLRSALAHRLAHCEAFVSSAHRRSPVKQEDAVADEL